jgi:hypothetical protein
MKHLTGLIALSLLIAPLCAVGWTWAHSFGATTLDRAWDLAVDPQDNVIFTGEFTDTLQVAETTLYGHGLTDAVVAKFDPGGHLLWARNFGGLSGDVGIGVDCDAAGNIYCSGYFSDSAIFGDYSLTGYGSWDAYIAKLSPDGDVLWVHYAGGAAGDTGYGIAVSPDGHAALTGWFVGDTQFDNGLPITGYGSSDILTACYNPNGSLAWTTHAGTAGVDYGYKVDCPDNTSAYITGVAGDSSAFGGLELHGDGTFIAKYDLATGNALWVTGAPGGAGPMGGAVKNGLGGVIAGRLTGSAQFGEHVLLSFEASDDIFYATFDPDSGTWTNAIVMGSAGADKGKSCEFADAPIVCATFENSWACQGTAIQSVGMRDLLVFRAGDQSGVLTGGGANDEVITDVAVASDGSIYMCGWLNGQATFGDCTVDSGGDYDSDFLLLKADFSDVRAGDDVRPSEISHLRCYPNPFNPILRIDCAPLSDEPGKPVKITVRNLRGQTVRELWNGALSDRKTITWDGCDRRGLPCASGIYFISLDNGTRVWSRRAMMVK